MLVLWYVFLIMKRRVRSRRHHRGRQHHRRSAQALKCRRERAHLHMCAVRARRLAWRRVRRIWLGSQARLVFDQVCMRAEAPELLEWAAKDLGQRLQSQAEQLFTDAGSPDVKDANHLCRHRWRVRVYSRAIFLSLSSNRRVGGAQLPYICVQGTRLLVRRVAYMFHSI